MRPTHQEIIPPINGWEEKTLYVVEVAFTKFNPIHTSIFYSGFLNSKKPGNYNTIFNPSYEQEYCNIDNIVYLKVLQNLGKVFDISSPKTGELPVI